jgi:threonine/homoserine/homoserine lactone efflux protein
MFDARFLTFSGVAVLLVLSPGPSFAVVTRNAIAGGRSGGILTALGVGAGNSFHAVASALGLSIVLLHVPEAFDTVRLAGAAYLAFLGFRGLYRVSRGQHRPSGAADTGRRGHGQGAAVNFGQGMVTNVLHPPVAFFYLSYLPQFIAPEDPFLSRFALLASVHVLFSVIWLSTCAAAVDRLARLFAGSFFPRLLETAASTALLVISLLIFRAALVERVGA